MTTVTESDIQELKALIVSIDARLTGIQEESRINAAVTNEKLIAINGRLDTLQNSVDKIPELAEKLGELKNWKQIGSIVITAFISSIFSGLIGGVIGWLIRSARFNP